MKPFLFILMLYLQCGLMHCDYRSYEGYKVIKAEINSNEDWMSLLGVEELFQLDFWKQPRVAPDYAVVMVNPTHLDEFMGFLRNKQIEYKVTIGNVQSAIESQDARESVDSNPSTYNDLDSSRYHNLTEITDWMATMPDFCTYDNDSCHVMSMGESFEGYPLNVFHIGRTDGERRGIWLDCGIHAREWISPAVCNYIIGRLILDVEIDEEVAALREMYDFFVESVVNPDGYEYTWTTISGGKMAASSLLCFSDARWLHYHVDRMWRKTRSPNEGSECIGTDGNRNFPFEWGGAGASEDPCSQTYRGSEASSEIEVTALTDFILGTGMVTGFDMLMTFHSFGKILLYPWAYTDAEDPEDIDDLIAAADVMVNTMNSVHDQGYIHGHPGVHSGSTMDWGKGAAAIKYSHLLELRDDGEYGFLLPEDQIQPCADEVWQGLKAMIFHMAESQQ